MSWRRLIGLASLATHLGLLLVKKVKIPESTYSSRVEAGLHGGAPLCADRVYLGIVTLKSALLALKQPVNLKVFAPLCDQDRSIPAFPCETREDAEVFKG